MRPSLAFLVAGWIMSGIGILLGSVIFLYTAIVLFVAALVVSFR